MSDEQKPNAADDVKKAFGLLFRAAKTAVDRLPSKKLEDVVTLGAKEVGRAIENVAGTIEKEFFAGGHASAQGKEPPPQEPGTTPKPPPDAT